jgi:tyramine---L-glutamate ligase
LRIFVYEFVTGGGWYCHGAQSPPPSLLSEGGAMLRSLVADFASISGVLVDVVRDVRYRDLHLAECTSHLVGSATDEKQTFARLASSADWTVVIAPEFRGYLQARCQVVEQGGGKLLGPSSRLVTLTSDKQATAEHLAAHGVRVPRGVPLAPGEALPADFPYPAVLKPRDGAGSQGIRQINQQEADRTNGVAPGRLEAFCEGTPASVAALCGEGQVVTLMPCRQLLTGDGRLAYLGGALPMAPRLAERATRLAERALGTLSDPVGYMGVDLVLGDDPSGDDDTVIEINPRMTTSYVGLRALAEGNLAEAMIAVAEGREVELCWHSGSIQFEASGAVYASLVGGGV